MRSDTTLDWVVCGGESGPAARPMHPDWARSLRDQCLTVGVAFHLKQNGAYLPVIGTPHPEDIWVSPTGSVTLIEPDDYRTRSGVQEWRSAGQRALLRPASKHHAGRLLDGLEWNEYPR